MRSSVSCQPHTTQPSTYVGPLDPDGQAREADGKRISQSVLDAMAQKELHAMRLGPGKHLKGRVLFDGVVKPEEVSSPTRYRWGVVLIALGSLITSTR